MLYKAIKLVEHCKVKQGKRREKNRHILSTYFNSSAYLLFNCQHLRIYRKTKGHSDLSNFPFYASIPTGEPSSLARWPLYV